MVTRSTDSKSAVPPEFDWQQLKQLAGEDTAFEVENIAHSLRGANANVGANALAMAVRQLAVSARSGYLTETEPLLQSIKFHCQSIERYLRSRLQSNLSSNP